MTDPTARTLELLSLLQTHRQWTGSELAERLGVTERTVRRDVDRLRDLGYPVDATSGVDGGYRLAVGSHVPPLLVDDDEATALVIGLQCAAVSAIEGIEATTVQLMAKLDQMLPDRVRRRVSALRSSVEVLRWSPGTGTVPAASLTVLSQACRDHEEVRFGYSRRDGEQSTRLVQPHQLVSAGRRWYLVAWDVRRDDWRTFRLDRMVEPRLAGARFTERELPGEDAASFVVEGIRSMSAGYRADVVLRTSAAAVEGLSRWFGATTVPLGDARTRLELSAESPDRLAAMIAIAATSFELDAVDAPPEVREALNVTARRLSEEC